MPVEFNVESVTDLLDQAEKSGIRIYYDGALRVRFPKGATVDEQLLQVIKGKEVELSDFLMKRDLILNLKDIPRPKSETINDVDYFEISPVQQWWVDEENDFDFKSQIYFANHLRLYGEFDLEIFKRAIYCLLERHESLRTAYRKTDHGFVMRILDEPVEFYYNVLDAREISDFSAMENFFFFKDHRFNVMTGPLFITRLIRKSSKEFLLSFKGHHSIFDAWSVDVLFRDLTTIYSSLGQNCKTGLAPLTLQYKDYIALGNKHRFEKAEEEKKYWNSTFRSIPQPLIIPSEHSNRDTRVGNGGCFTFDLPSGLLGIVNRIGAEHYTSQFVVLQASVMWYLRKLTGQNDLIIGTQIFGRSNSLMDIENQIGCFVHTTVVRALLDDEGTFDDCVERVRKCNDDMHTYTAFTLLDWVQENLGPGCDLRSVWKVSVQYNDLSAYVGYDIPAGPFSISNVAVDAPITINISMKIEFFKAAEDDLKAKVTYNTDNFSEDGIASFFNGYVSELQSFIISNNVKGF